MGLLEHSDVYWKFSGQCTQCGHCTKACDSLVSADMTLGEIANALLEAERNSADTDELRVNIAMNGPLVQAVRGCFFCTTCKNTCFAHNDVCDLIYHARVDFQKLGLISRDAWSSVLVDQEWDIFTAYRAIHGIGYTDLVRHVATEEHEAERDCKVAFFPGCSLAAYGPELTREIFAAVEEIGGKTTMIDHCCGSPLKSAGFYERAEALCERIVGELRDSGAERVVCVCPGCANAMRVALAGAGLDADAASAAGAGEGADAAGASEGAGKGGAGGAAASIEVESLAGYLARNGFTPKHPLPDTPLCISKSCQDRDGTYLDETFAVLGIEREGSAGESGAAGAGSGTAGAAGVRAGVPTIFRGCCGAGGGVSAFDPERQDAQADGKLSFAPDGSTVVTMCPTCTYTYAFRLMNGAPGAARDLHNKHYTELLFDNQFDWNLVFYQLGSMWNGEYGPWLASVFA